jgi:hypothetical protein
LARKKFADRQIDDASFKGQLIRICYNGLIAFWREQNMHNLQLLTGAVRIKTRGDKRGRSWSRRAIY